MSTVIVGETFKPDKAVMKLYYTYLLIVDIILFLVVVLPLVAMASLSFPMEAAIIVSLLGIVPILICVGFISFWIRRYYESVSYKFTEDEIIIERGVWWRHKNIVPYNRVTNIDIIQGPLSRRFGLGKVLVHTAGYSATGSSGTFAEAQIFGIRNFEEIRGFILKMVRGFKPVSVEAEAHPLPRSDEQILAELRRIREILETRTDIK